MKTCENCRYKRTCSGYKEKLEANGLGEDVEFKCKEWESEN